ncbi:Mucin-21 [Aspergillus hancockii]|nr:Mucin-21 [Aspergillus hancockii]
MRVSIATFFAALAAGVVAEEVSTVTVTETATYCPLSTDAISVPATESISIPSGYTTTRPLITSTVTECNKCSSTGIPAVPTSTPEGVNPVGTTSSILISRPVPTSGSSSQAFPSPSPSPSSSSIRRPSSSIAVSSTPLVQSTKPASNGGSAPSASSPSGASPTGSTTTPAVPLFTSGGSRAAVSAGVGLATVFGLAAALL